MPRDLISRYVWIIDTLTRYGKLSRADINRLWVRSPLGDGNPIPERSFYHYRRAIEENFHIDIHCNSRGEYYIEQSGQRQSKAFTNMLLDSYAVGSAMKDSQEIASRIDVEDVPSAREFLPMAIEAIRESEKISFTYAGFNRSRPEKDIIFRPEFVKRYKQRWYMVGIREKTGDIRTYALDRVREMKLLSETFTHDPAVDAGELFGNIIGVTSSKAQVKTVTLRVTPTQAKYFRALPLHSSQQETEIHDLYSVFTYRLKLNYELVHEILGLGDAVTVVAPPELRAMVVTQLKDTLSQYENPQKASGADMAQHTTISQREDNDQQ